MFGSKKREARLQLLEAEIAAWGEAYEAISATNMRLAGAVDELERRINNNQITVNAAFAGLSRRVGGIAQDTLDAVEAIKQQIAVVPSAAVPPSVPPASQGPTDGGLTLTAYEQAALDAQMTSSDDMDALMVHGLTAPSPRLLFGKDKLSHQEAARLHDGRATVHEDAALDRARADR